MTVRMSGRVSVKPGGTAGVIALVPANILQRQGIFLLPASERKLYYGTGTLQNLSDRK